MLAKLGEFALLQAMAHLVVKDGLTIAQARERLLPAYDELQKLKQQETSNG